MPQTPLTSSARLLGLVACVLLLSSLAQGPVSANTPPLPGICSESDRFGVAGAGWISNYDVEQLNAGWYHTFTIAGTPPTPAGMRYVQTIRLSDDGPLSDRACSACPAWDTIAGIAQANPGSLWVVGNEPDRQDLVYADRYAQLYYDFYAFLKEKDPSSLIGIGGVVQATPLRLQYLDQILDAYQSKYGAAMPVDVWNLHHYLLREADDWGGGVPPGTDKNLAIYYTVPEHDMLGPHPTEPDKLGWKEHLVQFRHWMKDRGYQDRPLIITEYGILMPDIYDYDYERVKRFMLATFDWLTTAQDPTIGYPADGDRLVQAWAWFSLDDAAFEGFPSWSHLFDPHTRAISQLGLDYGNYTSALTDPYPGTIDLQPVALWYNPPQWSIGDLATVVLSAQVFNGGSEPAQNVVVQFLRNGTLVENVTIANINAGQTLTIISTWSSLSQGQQFDVTVVVDPDDQVFECNPYNNALTISLFVADQRAFLPLIQKGH